MLALAGQTTRPNGLKFLDGTHGYWVPWGNIEEKNRFFSSKIKLFKSAGNTIFILSKAFPLKENIVWLNVIKTKLSGITILKEA